MLVARGEDLSTLERRNPQALLRFFFFVFSSFAVPPLLQQPKAHKRHHFLHAPPSTRARAVVYVHSKHHALTQTNTRPGRPYKHATRTKKKKKKKVEGDDLAQHGPCKPPDKQGLDEDIQAEAEGIAQPPRGPTFCKDPNGKRDGNAPIAQVQEMLRKALDDAAMVGDDPLRTHHVAAAAQLVIRNSCR